MPIMKLTYIYHSCFAIEADNLTVIIDYFKDTEGYDKGIVHDYLLNLPGKIYVLASHFHPDHFSKEVLSWKDKRPDIIYIFSKDILKHRRAGKEDAVYIKKLESYEDDSIMVKAYGSTDVGVSFYIETQGKRIFHAGDLNNWHWNEESTPEESRVYEKNYMYELKTISGDIQTLDVAMFPVDSRLGKDYMRGPKQFIDRIDVKTFVPMHFDEEYDKANAFEQYTGIINIRFMKITHKGQSIEF